MAVATRIASPDELLRLRERLAAERAAKTASIAICGGTGCRANGAIPLAEEFRRELLAAGLDHVAVRTTGCHGFCEKGPLVVIHPQEVFYHGVGRQDVAEIIETTVRGGEVVERLLYKDPVSGRKSRREREVPFYAKQQRLVFRHNGIIDPTEIGDYIAVGGYSALTKALTQMSPEEIIEQVSRAGLRGRGGGGFPTGKKWAICRAQPGEEKFIICNGDEGDPGAFMDRSIMEGDPHGVLEGMTIGAFAIGAHKGYIYVRAEYPLAVANLTAAVRQSRELGLLGEDILGSGFSFDVEIVRGAGAFVCGEETGLIASIEGEIGSPRQRPPYPAQEGLWGLPTNINNVETWANVPVIIERGPEWFAAIGTEHSKGTKVFSLVGKVKNTGLVEVPMGTTLREIVFDIGGGIQRDRAFKAVQTGGPSGGCIPEGLLDLPVDFEALTSAGAMMGSGGLIVMDERTCMVDVAKYFTGFLVDESCGKCTPCREGLLHMQRILTRITDGEGREGDIELLERLGHYVKNSSLCMLGGTAPNPVLSTIRYFRHEYEAHIRQKTCPAGVCKPLVTFRINPEKCRGCTLCVKSCPSGAIVGERKKPHAIEAARCVKCGACREECRFDAVLAE